MKKKKTKNSKIKFDWQSGRPSGFTKLFTVVSDKDHWLIEEVGTDAEGHYVLSNTQDYVLGASIATMETYAVLTKAQYLQQLDKALAGHFITAEQHERLKA